MAHIPLYQVDAFTNEMFKGNPAAVCLLRDWLSDELMQQIGAENNLAETAFIIPHPDPEGYAIRWFTPTVEVDLCGHATLAAAHVMFNHTGYEGNTIHFWSPHSGALKVSKTPQGLTLNFPVDTIAPVETPTALINAFGKTPKATFRGKTDYMCVFEQEDDIINMQPNIALVNEVEARGVIVTAPGTQVDFVSRFFAPQSGIDEDPVTGSAHTTLTPYWSKALGKDTLTARQLSKRTGDLQCTMVDDRVEISGQATTYMMGHIELA